MMMMMIMIMMMMMVMMKPDWIQTKTNTRIRLQDELSEARRLHALSQQLEVGGLLTVQCSSASHVRQPNPPHQTPAPVIDGSKEN